MEYKHVSVMKEECMQALNLKNGGIYFDGTLGGSGHSYEILKRTSPQGKLIATDLDEVAIENAKEKLSEFDKRFMLFHRNFKEFNDVLDEAGVDLIDGALLDLGFSSNQLSTQRGFSYMDNQILDMRMNKDSSLDARQVINEYSEEDLTEIFYKYGEEKFSKLIAKNIVNTRKTKKIETTGELVEIIEKSIPVRFQTGGHPAKRIFQAVRIEVNGELSGLDKALIDIVKRLKKGGRIAVITFHSLEDRIVKNTFAELEKDCVCDKRLPVCVCGKKREIKLVNKKPITATEEEVEFNSRAKSAKLRIAEKV